MGPRHMFMGDPVFRRAMDALNPNKPRPQRERGTPRVKRKEEVQRTCLRCGRHVSEGARQCPYCLVWQ